MILLFDDIPECQDFAALAFVICKHLGQLLFIITRNAVRQHMNGVSAFRHIKAGGFDARRGIRTDNIKIGNVVFPNEIGKILACQRIAF